MIRLNENYFKLQSSYLFSQIAERVTAFQAENPNAKLIKLGIGDVTHAISPLIAQAFREGVEEQTSDATFRGYGPEQGYPFLREAIANVDFAKTEVKAEEIFVSDGAKCDTSNFQELFAHDLRIAIPDPVYPVYVDSNVMAGRSGEWKKGRYEGFHYLEGREENNFIPLPPKVRQSKPLDLIYLCFPNNPTGTVASREVLEQWVAYAQQNKAIILFDSAYVEFIRNPDIPRSIFEIPGARQVAVEFRSLSKTAGFTGIRCAYTVVPSNCLVYDKVGKSHSLRQLWFRRQSTKFNGVGYPVQRAAAEVFSPEGQVEIRQRSNYYLENAHRIRNTMLDLGFKVWGGENSPYIWVKSGASSWELFDRLLREASVVSTPGAGFGKCGEGFIRLSSFNHREEVEEAMDRFRNIF